MGKKILFIFIFIALALCLSGCDMRTKEQKQEDERKMNELVQTYSSSFIEQAKVQYGLNAEVSQIVAETYGSVDPLGTYRFYISGNLIGVININSEIFDALYYVDSNEIYSLKNYDKIIESMEEFFEYLNLDIIDSTIFNRNYGKYERDYLPDNIITFEDMLENKYIMSAYLFVLNDLKHISEDDFLKLEAYWNKYKSSIGRLIIVQIKDQSSAEELKAVIDELDFSSEDHPTIYIPEKRASVDVFEEFNIYSTVYISYYNYNDKIRHEFRFQYLSR